MIKERRFYKNLKIGNKKKKRKERKGPYITLETLT